MIKDLNTILSRAQQPTSGCQIPGCLVILLVIIFIPVIIVGILIWRLYLLITGKKRSGQNSRQDYDDTPPQDDGIEDVEYEEID